MVLQHLPGFFFVLIHVGKLQHLYKTSNFSPRYSFALCDTKTVLYSTLQAQNKKPIFNYGDYEKFEFQR